MFADSPVFIQPDNENIKLWRYIDFAKLVDLLDKKALFFSRADQFKDPYEGSYSEYNIIMRSLVNKEFTEVDIELWAKVTDALRKFTLVNCWHMNDFESAAMWDLYSNNGVAIQSSYKKLKNAFFETNEEIYIGKVNYIDYGKEFIPEGNLFYPFLYKRKSFEHEKELRCVYQKIPMKKEIVNPSLEKPKRLRCSLKEWGNVNLEDIDSYSEPFKFGKEINVDLNILVENIYISPTAPEWFEGVVKSVIEKYGFNFKVENSSLYNGPLY